MQKMSEIKKITKNHKKFVEGMKNGLSNDGSKEFKDLKKAGLIEFYRGWCFTRQGIEVIRASYTIKSLYKKFYKTELGKSLFPEENKKRRAREEARTTKQTTPTERLRKKRLLRAELLSLGVGHKVKHKAGDATYTSAYSLDWDGYSRRCKYPKKIWDNRLLVDTTRKTPLFEENDGIFNLTCLSRKKLENFIVELNEVAIKKQGYSLEIKKIYIAFLEDGSLSYHADSVKKAVAGLKNKLKRKVAKLKPSDKMTRAKYARLTGACKFGIESFLKEKGLENLTEITVAELLPLIKGQYGEKTILAAMEE